MTFSKRHHYIPQFYLKGFTDSNGEYYVFDKKTEEIRKSNPPNSFFVNNRNTSLVKDEKIVMLEEMYAHFDRITALQLEKIRTATLDEFVLDPEILSRIRMFIVQMFWRVPANDEKIEKLIDKLSFAEAGFDFKSTITGKSMATPELEQQLKNIDAFRKMYRIIIPLISARGRYQSTDFENWRLYFRKDKLHLTSDNPLIIKEFIDFSSLNSELFFPLSADRLFVHTRQAKPKALPPSFLVELDLLILQQATRFVCCPNKQYLESLVKNLYSYSKNCDFVPQMKESLFKYFV